MQMYTKLFPDRPINKICFGFLAQSYLSLQVFAIDKQVGTNEKVLGRQFLDSLVVRISACHVEGPGSIPGRGEHFLALSF